MSGERYVDLPSLTAFKSEEDSFTYMGTVVLQSRFVGGDAVDIPRLLSSGIDFVDGFCYTYALQFKSRRLESS